MADFTWNGRSPNKQSPVPLYYQLAEMIEARIVAGDLQPGDRLPSERDLATQAGISRMTARQALTWLAERGAIEVRHGVGTFVAQPKLTSDPLHLLGFTEQMMATGGTVSSSVLAQEVLAAPPSVAAALGLAPGTDVVRIMRLRSLNGTPVLLETSYFPHARFAGIEERDLAHQSLYTLLDAEFGIRLTHAQQTVEAIGANEFESDLFGIARAARCCCWKAWPSPATAWPGSFSRLCIGGTASSSRCAPPRAEPASAASALPIGLVLT